MPTARVIRVFASSPSDVAYERRQLAKVVAELNTTFRVLFPETPIVLELIRWETHVHPDMGDDAQDVVMRQIGDYEIFFGIMWSRFGTPTRRAGSGTEEEFRSAYEGWLKGGIPSHLLFYFSRARIPAEEARAGAEQLARVRTFREELSQRGLVWHYSSKAAFADTVRPHLVDVVAELLRAVTPASEVAARELVVPKTDLDTIRGVVAELAAEYEHVRRGIEARRELPFRLHVWPSLRSPMQRLIMPNWLAITIGRHIFTWRQLTDAELAHELVHVEQWLRYGGTFILRYFEASRRAARSGLDRYHHNEFEREAAAADVIASQMRAVAWSSVALLTELTPSESPGRRLAAITALEEAPHPLWLQWLAERFGKEADDPFLRTHAALALLQAARVLPDDDIPAIRRALEDARSLDSRLHDDADATRTLQFADQEVTRRRRKRKPRK